MMRDFSGSRISFESFEQLKTSRLIGAAAVWHLLATAMLFLVGRLRLMPGQFEENGLGAFASDGFRYQLQVRYLANLLMHGHGWSWLDAPAQLHVKLYSLSYTLFSSWAGFNILTIEPINLFYYLVTLVFTFQLAQEIFDRRIALLASLIIALWPSYLLHTTQLLRDPLLMSAILVLVLAISLWLTKNLSWHRGLLVGAVAILSALVIWIVRIAMWDVARAVVLLGVVLFVIRQLRERRWLKGNMLGAALLVAAVILIPQARTIFQEMTRQEEKKSAVTSSGGGSSRGVSDQEWQQMTFAEKMHDAPLPLWQRIAEQRQAFVKPQGVYGAMPGSNIDADTQFHSMTDMILYLPRAVFVGLFAPFPSMWFGAGSQVGTSGRLLSGFEMLLTYLIEILALAGFWQKRQSLVVWLLALTVGMGATSLGLIVINIGTLYRVRYPFWMMLTILGAGGAAFVASKVFARRRAEEVEASVMAG
ncbi:MAG: hypothetical protein WBP93_09175 [Pyrinomonadaceae bacterium]